MHGLYWSNKEGITLNNTSKNNAFWDVQSPYVHTGLDNLQTYYYRVAVWDGLEVRLSTEVSAKPN
jgi:hypothetical protein